MGHSPSLRQKEVNTLTKYNIYSFEYRSPKFFKFPLLIQISCAWLINTTPGKVMNVSFTRFHLEGSLDCKFDWVQVVFTFSIRFLHFY